MSVAHHPLLDPLEQPAGCQAHQQVDDSATKKVSKSACLRETKTRAAPVMSIAVTTPRSFFENPAHERTKLFLDRILR